MAAVTETAVGEIAFHIFKCRMQSLRRIPHAELSHAGHINDHGAGKQAFFGKKNQLTVGGGMAASGIVFPDFSGGHETFSGESVDQGGFSNAGRAQENRGFSGQQVWRQRVKSPAGSGADGNDGDAGSGGLCPRGHFCRIIRQIGLGEEDDRRCSRFPGLGQIALQPPRIQIVIQGLQNENIVKICRSRLPGMACRGRIQPGKNAFSGKCFQNQAVTVLLQIQKNKVSDGWTAVFTGVVSACLQTRVAAAGFADKFISVSVNGGNSRRILHIVSRGQPGGIEAIIGNMHNFFSFCR